MEINSLLKKENKLCSRVFIISKTNIAGHVFNRVLITLYYSYNITSRKLRQPAAKVVKPICHERGQEGGGRGAPF